MSKMIHIENYKKDLNSKDLEGLLSILHNKAQLYVNVGGKAYPVTGLTILEDTSRRLIITTGEDERDPSLLEFNE